MTGRAFRAGTDEAFYEFTFASGTTGSLDRVYEGTTNALATYSIHQSVYPLGSDVRLLEDDAFASFGFGQLERVDRGVWTANWPWAYTTDLPSGWCSYMDDSSTPPRLQVELFPIPSESIGIPYQYIAEGPALATSTQIIQVWLQPAALIEGASAKIKRHLGDYAGAREHDMQAAAALSIMKGAEAHGMAPMRLQMDDYFTGHRRSRANR